MLTYDLAAEEGLLYQNIYNHIREDIVDGRLPQGFKLPSKRSLAKNLGVSIITVQNAYDQLVDEGYVITEPKKGYFISDVASFMLPKSQLTEGEDFRIDEQSKEWDFDFSSNHANVKKFPFSVWAKLMRETISMNEDKLLKVSPSGGVLELREAIAKHLNSFRGMQVNADQIVVGAGTEYLYGLLIKLLGQDKKYCIENPGYKKIAMVYASNQVDYSYAGLDEKGINVKEIYDNQAQIAHISATHHFPTGITMPIDRRKQLLEWAGKANDRYIIEDDYDSEFRFNGRPIPPLMSMDNHDRVIYVNTFSKSLTSTIRIAYMVLPISLAREFYDKLSFYSCTVSTFEQYTLARFIQDGYFEKHINRMRRYYGKMRKSVLDIISQEFSEKECKVIENDSGLHFILRLNTSQSDEEVKSLMENEGIRIRAITDFDALNNQDKHQFLLDYSGIEIEGLKVAILTMKKHIVFDK